MKKSSSTYQRSYDQLYKDIQKASHQRWGGIITLEDFNTNRPNKYRIDKQFAAEKYNKSKGV